MADGNILSAGTQVDLSGIQNLKTELAILQEQYRSVSTDIRQSVNRIADAEKQATESIAAGHKQLAVTLQAAADVERQALTGLITQQDRVKASIAETKSALNPQPTLDYAAAMRQLAIVEALAAQGAVEEKAAVENMAAAHGHAVTEIQATSGALRVLEGSGGIRAAERLLTTIPGLGGALQTIFPAVGLIALVEVFARMGEHIDKLINKTKDIEQIRDAFTVLNEAVQTTNDELIVSNDRLENEIAKIEHKPENALKLALDEAIVSADKLAESLNKDLGALQKVLNENKVSLIGEIFGKSGTSDLDEEIKGFQRKVSAASASNIPRQENVGGVSLFEPKLLEQQKAAAQTETNTKLTTLYREEIQKLNHELQTASAPGAIDASNRIEILSGAITNLNAQLQSIESRTQNTNLQGQKGQAQAGADQNRQAVAAAKKEQEEIKRSYDEQLADLKADHEVTKAEELAFRTTELNDTRLYGDALISVKREVGALSQEVDKENLRAEEKQVTAVAKHGEALMKEQEKIQKENDKDAKKWAKYFDEINDAADKDAKKLEESLTKIADLKTKGAEDTAVGGINQQKLEVQRGAAVSPDTSTAAKIDELEKLRDLDAQEAQIRINSEQDVLARLKTLYGQESTEYQTEQNKIVALKLAADQKMYADTTKILQAEKQQYQQFFNTLTSGFQKVANDALTNNHKWYQDLSSILTKLVEEFVDYEIKRAVTHLATNNLIQSAESALMAVLRALHLVDATAAVATDKGVAAAQVTTAAGIAAANAYAATAIIPVVGPELAPAAAASAYAGALAAGALAALETGTNYVPQTGLYQLHAGEAVVPKQYNPAAGGSGGGSGNTFNVTQNIQGGPQHSPGQIADMAVGKIQSLMRRQNQVPA